MRVAAVDVVDIMDDFGLQTYSLSANVARPIDAGQLHPPGGCGRVALACVAQRAKQRRDIDTSG